MREQELVFGYAGMPLTGWDENGVWWSVNVADGWHAAAPVRTQHESKSGQDGSWRSTPLRGSRIVRLQGKMREAPSLAALEESIRTLTGVPLSGEVFGESSWGLLSGFAQIEDAPSVEILSPSVAVWQFTVALDDPLLYGAPVIVSTGLSGVAGTGRVWPRVWPRDWGVPAGQTPGAVTVPNDGRAAYWPLLRVDGPVPNPVITLNETGDWIRYNGTLTAGQWLDIDCGARRVLLNGQVPQSARMSYSGRWLAIPPRGGGSISWNADAADPAATLTVIAREGAWP